MKKFYITTPIYYVNDVPHIGHTYTTVAADVLSRWHRLCGEKVFFLTGTDEHGVKIYEAAKKAGKDIKEYCDEMAVSFKKAWELMDISYDRFIRTTDPQHTKVVNSIMSRLQSQGDIYFAEYEGLYCVGCEKYLTETDLIEGLCPDHRIEPSLHKEGNYFFKLSKYREKLTDAILDSKNPNHFMILPEGRKNEILGKLNAGLEDISISRAAIPWGIPLPFDAKQTTYVWVDALLNYVSGAGFESNDAEFNTWWPADVHLMAKDILWFHTVIWPSILLAAGLPLPKKIFAHGYFTISGQKMSKSLGNIIKPEELVSEFGKDASRFLLMGAFPFGADGDVNLDSFREKYNAHLANNIGNFISRVLQMADKYQSGVVAKPADWSAEIIEQAKRGTREIYKDFENLAIEDALNKILAIATFGNQYIDKQAPWNLAKNPADSEKLKSVLYNAALIIKEIAALLWCFMPQTSEKIWALLGESEKMSDVVSMPEDAHHLTGTTVKKPAPLFPRK